MQCDPSCEVSRALHAAGCDRTIPYSTTTVPRQYPYSTRTVPVQYQYSTSTGQKSHAACTNRHPVGHHFLLSRHPTYRTRPIMSPNQRSNTRLARVRTSKEKKKRKKKLLIRLEVFSRRVVPSVCESLFCSINALLLSGCSVTSNIVRGIFFHLLSFLVMFDHVPRDGRPLMGRPVGCKFVYFLAHV